MRWLPYVLCLGDKRRLPGSEVSGQAKQQVASLATFGKQTRCERRPVPGVTASLGLMGTSVFRTALFKVLAGLLVLGPCLIVLVHFSSCSVTIQPPPDAWCDTTDIGIFTGRRRMHADRFFRHDSLRPDTIPYVDFRLAVNTAKAPSNKKAYWVLRDPDDPASDVAIDSNGPDCNDNVGRAMLLLPPYQNGQLPSESTAETDITGQDNLTRVRISYPPIAPTTGYYPGDNFVLSVKLGDAGVSESTSSCTVAVWKRMKVELDIPDSAGTQLPSIFWDSLASAVIHPFVGVPLLGGSWDPNRCCYLDARTDPRSDDVLEDINNRYPRCLHLDPVLYPDRGNACYYALKDDYSSFIGHRETHPVYLYLAGGADTWRSGPLPGWGDFPSGISSCQLTDCNFSIAFLDTVWAVTTRETLITWDAEDKVVGCVKTALHEIWHQIAADSSHCSSVQSIMWDGLYRTTDPYFDPTSVRKLRRTHAIWQFGGGK